MPTKKKKKRKTREDKEAMKGYNPQLGMTDSQFRNRIAGDLRKLSRDSRVRMFVERMRIPYTGPKPGNWQVQCLQCEEWMTTKEEIRPRNANGTLRKKPTLKHQIDHIYGIRPLKSLESLNEFADDLFNGPLQILCYDCHQEKTKVQRKEREQAQQKEKENG